MSFTTKPISYRKIGELAEDFLSKYHPSFSLSVPIEEIAESKLDIQIVPVVGIKKDYDMDASLCSNFNTIFIDYNFYMNRENRSRFTIAHEIGHLILHKDLFESLKIFNIEDLFKISESISDNEYRWMEYQAYSFAGHVLVPKKLLIDEIKKKLGRVPSEENPESLYPVIQDLSDIFKVSEDVILRRLQKEKMVKSNH